MPVSSTDCITKDCATHGPANKNISMCYASPAHASVYAVQLHDEAESWPSSSSGAKSFLCGKEEEVLLVGCAGNVHQHTLFLYIFRQNRHEYRDSLRAVCTCRREKTPVERIHESCCWALQAMCTAWHVARASGSTPSWHSTSRTNITAGILLTAQTRVGT